MVTSAPAPDHRTTQPSRVADRGGSNSTDDTRDRKGKQRAEDVSADRLSTPSSRQDDAIVLGGGVNAGRNTSSEVSSGSRFEGNAAVLSTPPRIVNVATQSATEPSETSTSATAPRQARQPVRIRRNAWQTMQQHLTGGSRELRPIRQREGESGPEPVASSKSQAPTTPASVSGDMILRPENIDTPPSDDAVPSLLLRLSDPVSSTTRNTRNETNPGGPGSRRDALSTRKSGKSTTTTETAVRTQARPDVPSTMNDPPPASRRTSDTPSPGAAGRTSSENHTSAGTSAIGGAAGTSAIGGAAGGSCMPNSISSASHSTGKGSGATAADPRSLLMQKLELEKKRGSAISLSLSLAAPPAPTAEKKKAEGQLSSSLAPAHPRDGPGRSQAGVSPAGTRARAGARDGRALAELAGVAAVPELELDACTRADAERREAQLRSQAQLRVRLAAAKRAALQEASPVGSGAGSGNGHGNGNEIGTGAGTGKGIGDRSGSTDGDASPSTAGRDDSLVSQEMVLKSRLKARKV